VVLAGATHPWPGGIAWYYRLAASPILGALFVHTLVAPIGVIDLERSTAAAFAPLSGPKDYAGATSAALVLRPREFRWNARDVAALKRHVSSHAARYGEIRVPTAILASEDDGVVSIHIHARALARQIEGARLTVLEGAGHQIHYTARESVLAEIERVSALVGAAALPS
jgi:pimeloyl-ACP methyl ester carboxylesterase